MDTSPEYIKMCEKAKEIQDSWTPEYGDFFMGWTEYEVVEGGVEPDLWVVGECRLDEPVSPKKGYATWLPRQDQLQEMVYKHEGSADFYIVQNLCNFMLFVRPELFSDTVDGWPERMSYVVKFRSMEQLWLAFVMKEKFNKVWNGEDWE